MKVCDSYEVWSPYHVLMGCCISDNIALSYNMVMAELQDNGATPEFARNLIYSTVVSTNAIHKMLETKL